MDSESGSLVFCQSENILVESFITINVKNADGKNEVRQLSELHFIHATTRKPRFTVKDTKVYNSQGNRLEAKEIASRAKAGTQVLIVRQGDKIGLDYLFSLKKETLILVLPADEAVPMPEGVPDSFVIAFMDDVAKGFDGLVSEHITRLLYSQE